MSSNQNVENVETIIKKDIIEPTENIINRIKSKCNINYKSIFTLKQSQPYNLTANWPNNFIPSGTQFEPDTSLINLKTYDPKDKYHSF